MSFQKKMTMKVGRITFVVMLIAMVFSLPVGAQQNAPAPDGGVSVETATAQMAAPEKVDLQWSSEMPQLTEAQLAQITAGQEKMNLPGPERVGAEAEAALAEPAAPEAASMAIKDAPGAPGSLKTFRATYPGGVIPDGYKSTVMESSVASEGRYIFYTGNWFAARSTTGGGSWLYVNPFSDFASFCCDQVTINDRARNLILWYRQGIAGTNPSTGNYENYFRLGVSNNGGAGFCFYNFYPTGTNGAWTNQWWDYPHIQLGADYLYLATNMFNSGGSWTQTVMLKLPLDALRTCSGFGYSYFATNAWFTFVPVQGANHLMYFASNYPTVSPYNRLGIWKWDESAGLTFYDRTIAAWAYTNRNQAVCGSSVGNWLARTDDRLLSGARYEIENSNLKYPGRKVLGWFWNVKGVAGSSFPMPYIDAAAFFEDTMTQVPGFQGRPYVYNTANYCFAYPAVASNARGDLSMVFNIGVTPYWRPGLAYSIADDYSSAPPGWSFAIVRNSLARPADNKWGDYNTNRMHSPAMDAWVGAGHYIVNTVNCYSQTAGCSQPFYFVFGRERDYPEYVRYYYK